MAAVRARRGDGSRPCADEAAVRPGRPVRPHAPVLVCLAGPRAGTHGTSRDLG